MCLASERARSWRCVGARRVGCWRPPPSPRHKKTRRGRESAMAERLFSRGPTYLRSSPIILVAMCVYAKLIRNVHCAEELPATATLSPTEQALSEGRRGGHLHTKSARLTVPRRAQSLPIKMPPHALYPWPERSRLLRIFFHKFS